MSTEDFDYELPEELIAQTPLSDRTSSKLLVMDRDTGSIEHRHFSDIIDYLKKGDVLVLNDTKVIPARLIGEKESTKAHIELLLLKDLGGNKWECLSRPFKRIHVDTIISFGDGLLKAKVTEKKAEGIVFFKGTWQQALEQARKENKLIFMDCYTSWCGPCKMLAKEVFTDPEVAAFFNEKFVNVKVDMEKGEGVELKKQYKVSAYPTLNFINGKGELQHCVVGGMPADALIAQAKLALEGKGLIALQTLYAQGNRESQFIEDYLTALDMGNQAAEAEKVASEYLGKMEQARLKEKANWDMFNKYINDVDSDIFRYVYDNQNEFAGLFGEKEVRAKIRKVWTLGANRYVTGEGEEVVYDRKGFKKYVKRLSKADVDGKTDIIENARMTNAEKLGDWKIYIALGSEQLKGGRVGDLVLYNWGLRINRGCKDSALRMQAAQWFEDAAARSKEGEMSFKVYFERVANDLKQDYKEKK